MADSGGARLIEVDAATAIIKIKHNFAENLQVEAGKIADIAGDSRIIKLEHLRRAVPSAVQATLSKMTDLLGETHYSGDETKNAA